MPLFEYRNFLFATAMKTKKPTTPTVFVRCATTLTMAVAFATTSAAQQAEVADLSLEDLLKIDVTTVSRKTQQLQDVAAAVFVITAEDVRRSGVTSIPEALRMVPGVQVARIANNRWAVSARGFNGRFGNKLQVLMDGRSLYAPMFAGVIWEAQDTLLEDVERIEVIRGPGAAMWGANAVNGVINIITRKARDTQGSLVSAGIGTEERGFAAFRYGSTIGEDGHYRIYGKALARNEGQDAYGNSGNDDLRSKRVGYRLDQRLSGSARLTVLGDAYDTQSGDRWLAPSLVSPFVDIQNHTQINQGFNLLGRHEWQLEDGSEATLQAYFDQARVAVPGFVDEHRSTIDLDFQHRQLFGNGHDFIWGVAYRESHDKIASSGMALIDPTRRTSRLLSAFAQDEITLVPERFKLILGAKLEHNSATGFEPQPNARIVWTPTPTDAWWAAVSRAVRTPSRAERDTQLDLQVIPPFSTGNPTPFPVLVRNVPRDDHALQSEKLTAFEVGYRSQLAGQLSLDIAAFHNRYRDLRAVEQVTPQFNLLPTPHVVQAVMPNNTLRARAHGLEVALDWQPQTWWRIQPSYTYMHLHSRATGAPAEDALAESFEGSAPRHQLSVRSLMSIGSGHQFDAWIRHVSALAASNVPAYTTLDLRYGWRPRRGFELSLVAQNVLDRRHPEFLADNLPSQRLEVERGYYVKATWQF